jgi:hypothetical protein
MEPPAGRYMFMSSMHVGILRSESRPMRYVEDKIPKKFETKVIDTKDVVPSALHVIVQEELSPRTGR